MEKSRKENTPGTDETRLIGEALIRELAKRAHEPGITTAEHMRRIRSLESESQAQALGQQDAGNV